jgi:hypothetical protein
MVRQAFVFVCGWVVSLAVATGAAAGPGLPTGLEIGDGFEPFLRTRAAGTQNYACVLTGGGFKWQFVGPQATLYYGLPIQAATHFFSPNPDEGGTTRATWQHSLDTSRVWAKAIVTVDDPAIVGEGNIAWLKLEVVGDRRGPTGGAYLARARFIQRLNTVGGKAPATGCSDPLHVGSLALVPYTTDYVFFRESR